MMAVTQRLGAALVILLALACAKKEATPAGPVLQVSTSSGARTLSVARLRELPARQVEGYTGARMTDVLGEVPDGATVVAKGSDGYTQTLSASAAKREDCIVAYEQDGRPLDSKIGPLRILLPSSPGLSVRNLASLEVK
jgi:DMSO/TMAO reductase YedYZ molybdopterin-dependent catalytic subunit